MNDLLSVIHCPGKRLIDELFKTIVELNCWIEGMGELPSDPIRASFTYAGTYACIELGDVCVWDTEDTGESFSAADCKNEYLRHVRNLSHFLKASDPE